MTDKKDRLEVIKQGLPEQVRHDDWGGHFLTAEGEFGWPGAHVDWLIAQVEAARAALKDADAAGMALVNEVERLRAAAQGVVECDYNLDTPFGDHLCIARLRDALT